MAVTLAQFRIQFPVFNTATDALVQAKLDEAERMNDEEHFVTLYDDACYYLAADLLTRSPEGMQMQLVNDDGTTVYSKVFEKLKLKGHRRAHISGGGLT